MPKEVDMQLTNYVDKEVVFGIRPEDIWDVPSSDWIQQKILLESVIDFREIIGSETYLYVKVGKTKLTSRVNGMCDASSGSKFGIVINLNRVHFFDPASQTAII